MKNIQLRATGASCKECRRLKIKCDKMVPCGTCTKRGLQSLCPDGQLSGAKGSRYVLATAEESWYRIQALCVRVQDLEFALERAHSLVANERHPLLDEELIKIGQDPRAVVTTEPGKSPAQPPEDVPIADFGTMKISRSGAYRWLGTTALPAMAFDHYDAEEAARSDLVSDSMIPQEKLQSSCNPGLHIHPANELKASALRQLPSRQRALQLIEAFFECYEAWSTLIDRSTVIDTLFMVAYDGDVSSLSTYDLSSLFSILALGCLYDNPPDPSGQEFKAKRALAKQLFFAELPGKPETVDEIESLLLLYRVQWHFMENTPSGVYELAAWGIKLAEQFGLHRDPEPLNLPVEECARRRRVFWTLWFYDSLNSLILGQPPTLAKEFVDSKLLQGLNQAGAMDIQPRLTLVIQDILVHFLASKTSPTYAAVLRIDQKIREIDSDWSTPPLPTPLASSPGAAGLTLQEASSLYVRGLKSVLMLALHRTYFSYAILRPTEDPIGGRFSSSVIAVYESATTVVQNGLTVTRHTPWMHSGNPLVWMQYHTAVLVLYAFPTYLPYWPRSEDAMKMADSAMSGLFYSITANRDHISSSLPSLIRAQQKARESFAKYKNGQWTHPAAGTSQEEEDQELFLNNKFVITNASSYEISRDSTPSDHQTYPDSTSGSSVYRGTWVGFDSPIVPSEPGGHFSQGNSHILSPQHNDGHFDEASLYKNVGMDWSHAPAVPKMESPPQSAGLYSPHSHYPPQHSVRVASPSALQIPGEIIGVADHRPERHATLRRPRGLSKAHSFPSDHPAGYSSAGYTQTHTFQSMHAPHHIPSQTTPVGSAGMMHSLEQQQQHHDVHEPYGRWIQTTTHSQEPYRVPHTNGYASNPTVAQHSQLAPADAAGAVPIHVLEQSWNNFNVQRR